MRVLVTGADGFVGQHVVAELLSRGHDVVAGIAGDRPSAGTLETGAWNRVRRITFDLRDHRSVDDLVARAVPDAVVHLAASSSVSRSWTQPRATFDVNATGTLHLLLAVEALPAPALPRPVLLVGSAEAYGRSGTDAQPLTETMPLRPSNPYAASKAAQEMLGWAFAHGEAVRMIQTRTFPHLGPGQLPPFVAADWATQLLAIAQGDHPPTLRVGNLDVVRDFMDVRDGATAYMDLLDAEAARGVYNVCSGHGTSLGDLLEALRTAVGVDVAMETDPARLRPVDLPSLVGDPGRLMAETGWRPRRRLEESVRDLVAHLTRVAAGAGEAQSGSET